MSSDHIDDFKITCGDDFQSVLEAVVYEAVAAGVDVRGAWEIGLLELEQHWEINIVELAREVKYIDD